MSESTWGGDGTGGLPPLRLATAGSVDDGKSTLIGRLLHDTKTVFEDQLAAVAAASRRLGEDGVNLALVTDGLRAEREQGITIDVAYRYFATPRRSFVVADTPGHNQYTRNMVTGSSSAEVAVVLVDARHGMVPQTRRHAFIAALVGVRAIALAVNKMDLVEWDQGSFDRTVKEVEDYVGSLATPVPVVPFPISALHGDNVVSASAHSPWHTGPTLLEWLETFDARGSQHAGTARLDVQRVIRAAAQDFRGYAGRLAGGTLAVGDPVQVLPGGQASTVQRLQRLGRDIDAAVPGEAITVVLTDDVDVARGDVLVTGAANVTERVRGEVCWMVDTPLRAGSRLWFKHGTRTGRAVVDAVVAVHDVDTLEARAADEVRLNDLATIEVVLSEPVVAASYAESRVGGRMILIDEATNVTAGALVLRDLDAR
jgi:sulfate adenylyltransferase large subunit